MQEEVLVSTLIPILVCFAVFLLSVFAWEAKDRGLDVHQQADPTKMELLYSDFRKKKENFKQDMKDGVLEKVC